MNFPEKGIGERRVDLKWPWTAKPPEEHYSTCWIVFRLQSHLTGTFQSQSHLQFGETFASGEFAKNK